MLQVATINFAGNKMHNLAGFREMPNHLSSVVNLSLEENNISEYRQLDNLKNIKLRDLVLSGNPIAFSLDEGNYQRY